MAINVGIDFGTSNSGVSIVSRDQVKILPLDPKRSGSRGSKDYSLYHP